MALLTSYGQQVVHDVSSRYGVSQDAVQTLLIAVNNGGGTQAQFSHTELGGMGQWSMGGMTMVGDMFNNGLKYTVDQLCTELSNAMANGMLFQPPPPPRYAPASRQSQSQSSGGDMGASFSLANGFASSAWPAELGYPSSTGSQNNLRYAVFPDTRRLAIDVNGLITVYDIGDHQIGGFSQQQGGDQSMTFTSQYGVVRVADLPTVQMGEVSPSPEPPPQMVQPEPYADQTPAPAPVAPVPQAPVPMGNSAEIFALIEQVANLHKQGILSDAEFESKKSELLARI